MAGDRPEGPRAELGDEPPFLTCPRIYWLVVGALVAQIIAYAVLTAAYR